MLAATTVGSRAGIKAPKVTWTPDLPKLQEEVVRVTAPRLSEEGESYAPAVVTTATTFAPAGSSRTPWIVAGVGLGLAGLLGAWWILRR